MKTPDPKLIINEVERLSGGKLKFRDDIEKLIEIAAANLKMDILAKISFDAKFLTGLLGVIQKKDDTIEPHYFDKAVNEYKDGIERVKFSLNELLLSASEFYRSIFNEKFLGMSQSGLQNLNFLCSDLSYLKLFFNDQKASEL